MSRIVKSIFYLVGSGIIGLACMSVFQPSQAEIERIKNFSPRNPGFAAAIESAATSKDPIYRLKSSQVQERVQETLKKRET